MERPARTFTLVQALRGLAALWVVLFHASEGGHIPALEHALPRSVDLALFGLGHYGVAIFFALSGFVIAHSIRDARMTGAFLGRFALRRSIRLDPPYWASMLVVVGLGYAAARARHAAFPLPSAGQVATHMTYLQEILGVPELNAVYWTLTYEVQFYLFFTLALVLAHYAGPYLGAARAAGLAWAALSLLAGAAALGWLDGVWHGLFLPMWDDFFVGAIAYEAVRARWARPVLALLALVMVTHAPITPATLFAPLSALTAIGLFAATLTGWSERGLRGRALQFLGGISYSLYLVHNPITGAAAFVAHRLAGAGIGADVIVLAAVLAASLVAATLFWLVVERASHRLSRRVRLPRAPHHDPAAPVPA